MDANVNEKLKKLYNKYGPYFNMSLCHLMDVGLDNILNVDLEKVRDEAQAREDEILAKGNIPIMTVDFQVQIVRLAQEIREVTDLPSDLIVFAMEHEIYTTKSPSKTELRKFAENIYWMALEENDEYEEHSDWINHVAECFGMEPEDINELMGWK